MKQYLVFLLAVCCMICVTNLSAQESSAQPLKIGVAGMSHDHIGFLMNRKGKSNVQVVGVYEPNKEMALRYAKRFSFDTSLIYTDLDKMLEATKPEAVAAFGPIF